MTSTTSSTTAATPFIKASVDVNVQFRVGGLKDLFTSPGAKAIHTPTIIPGFKFKVKAEQWKSKKPSNNDRAPVLVCRIFSEPGHVRPPFNFSLACTSMSGDKIYESQSKSKSGKTFPYKVKYKWGIAMLYKEDYDVDPSLQRDDAVLVIINLTYEPDTESNIGNPGLELVRRYVQQNHPSFVDRDVRFVTYGSVSSNSRLVTPRTLHCSSEVLRKHGIDVATGTLFIHDFDAPYLIPSYISGGYWARFHRTAFTRRWKS